MESQIISNKIPARVASTTSASSGANQLYISESLELPEDTFRMSLDNFSVIGENVTIAAERDTSVDTLTSSNVGTPVLVTPTPTPEIQMQPEKSPPIIDTPKATVVEKKTESVRKPPPSFLPLSLSKNTDHDDIFVKPSPVPELMSPARMLQFEVNYPASFTPTMKRAAIDLEFFKKNKPNEFFDDDSEEMNKPPPKPDTKEAADSGEISFEEQVIRKLNTVRHEIAYGKYHW